MTHNAASFVLAFFMGAPLVAPAQPVTYRLEQIPTFDEPNAETLGIAFAINELGEAVGIAEDAQLIARGFLYQAGHFSEIPGFGTGLTSDVRAINQFAEVAGGAMMNVVFNDHAASVAIPFVKAPGGPPRALLTDDEIHRDGIGGRANAINDAGAVVFEGRGSWIALGDGARVPLDLVLGEGINNRGQAIGYGLPPDALGFEALVFDLETRIPINLNDRSVARNSFANDINNSGVIVGEWALHTNNRTVPVIWENLLPRQLPFVNEETVGWVGRAVAINDRGDILGESQDQGSGEQINWLLFAGTDTPIPLLDLVDQGFFDGFDDFLAFDLNNSREVAGAAIRNDPDAFLGSTNKPAILRPVIAVVPPWPAPGLWANPAAPGAGLEINRVGDRHYLIWYTYDQAGLPTWYFSGAVALTRDGWRADLYRFSRPPNGIVQRQRVGQVVLSNRSESALRFSWRLAGRGGTEAYRYLVGDCASGGVGLTGTWYDPDAPGFGVSLQQSDGGLASVFYFYDLAGQPRWVFLDFPNGAKQAEAWLFTDGACPGCAPPTPVRSTVGLGAVGIAGDRIDFQIDLPASPALPAIGWQSDNRMARLSSTPACG